MTRARRELLVGSLFLVSFVLAGCLDPSCGASIHWAEKDWTQEDVYPRFPSEGYVGGFGVSWSVGPESYVDFKSAQKLGSESIEVRATEYNAVHFHIALETVTKVAPPSELAAMKLNETFATLGLGVPAPPDGSFDWVYYRCGGA